MTSHSQAIDASYNFQAEGTFPANERRRWHGTKRERNVGDPGTTPTGFCKPPTCSMCIIMQQSFDKGEVCAGFNVWEGYLYIGNVFQVSWIRPASRCRAMLIYRVLAGTAKRLTTADHNFIAAPAGFDSVRGVPGGVLNYDEVIFYDDNQIRPLYLFIFDGR